MIFLQKNVFFLCVLTVILTSMIVAERVFSRRDLGDFYSNSWAPALIYAQRNVYPSYYEEFSNTEGLVSEVSKVKSFLNMEVACLDTEAESKLSLTEWKQQNKNSIYTYYLQFVAGSFWKIFGTCWRSIEYLGIIQYVLSVCFLYGIIFTITGFSRLSLLLTFSEVFLFRSLLSLVTDIRDFSKVPFIFLIILITIKFLVRSRSLLHMCIYALVTSVLIAIGVGFRTDVKIFIPIILGVILFHAIISNFTLKKKFLYLLPVLIFLVSYNFFSIPEKKFRGDFHHSAHVAILGQTTAFYSSSLEKLIFKEHSDIGAIYADPFAVAVVENKASQIDVTNLSYLNSEYEKTGIVFLIESFLDHPFSYLARYLKSFTTIYSFYGVLLFLIVLYIYIKVRVTSFGFLIFLYLYFTAFQNIQLSFRHYFFVEVFNLFWLAIIIWYLIIKKREILNYAKDKFNSIYS